MFTRVIKNWNVYRLIFVVGGIQTVRRRLNQLKINSDEINYPESIRNQLENI